MRLNPVMAAADVTAAERMHACTQMAGSGTNLALQLPVTGVLNSLVTLSVDAEALTLTSNEAPGRVLSAQVCPGANYRIGLSTLMLPYVPLYIHHASPARKRGWSLLGLSTLLKVRPLFSDCSKSTWSCDAI